MTLPALRTFALLGLGLAERRRRRLWRLDGGRRGCGGGGGGWDDFCYHVVDGGRDVGGCQGGVGGRCAPQRVVGAELTPLSAQNHHHLGHGDLGVLGCDERPERRK